MALLENGRADLVMKYLRDHNYKNVAVLRFEVKKGSAPMSMAAGQLNSLMATRLENALIHLVDKSQPIGITRGASAVAAAKDRQATYHTVAGRQNLFKFNYPLAWNNQSVKVDAFLTGRLETSQNFRDAKVTIVCFDQQDPTPKKVLSFTVKTDRSTLRDMGQSFVIAKRSLNMLARDSIIDDEELDSEATKDVGQDNKKPDNSDPNNPNPSNPPSGSNNVEQLKQYLDFQIMVDNYPATITPHGADGKIDTPAAGQKVLVKLKAKVKLGLVLRVNGVNTAEAERDDRKVENYCWWVLEPDMDYHVRGFYNNGRVKLFQAVAKNEVDESELGDRRESWGKFELDVFVVKEQNASAAPKIQHNSSAATSLRKMLPRSANLATVQRQVNQGIRKDPSQASTKKPGQMNIRSRVLIVGRGEEDSKLETTAMDNAVHVGGCAVLYNLSTDLARR
jgi:hypothetical protein